MNPNDIIIRPVVSEKSTELLEQNKYVFEIAFRANKTMVKEALKQLFGVNVEKVNIIRVRGKVKRLRYRVGRTAAWKKAIVTLKAGDKIQIFEGQ